VQNLNLETSYQWSETPGRFATGGWTTSDLDTYTAANIGTAAGTPNYALINIGVNDLSAIQATTLDEATWKASMPSILDDIHATHASCQIYIMRVWARTYGTECDTLAGWIADLVTLNSSFVHLGPDERVFLENGDDGATYTADGTHPNAAGYALSAIQWQSVLGY